MANFRLFAGSELSLGTVLAQRDLGVLGNHSAVQNMLLAARALGLGATLTTLYLQSRKKRRPLLSCRPAGTRMPCCRSAIPGAGSGQFAVFRWPMSSTKTDRASLTGICSDLVAFTRGCLSSRTDRLASVILNVRGRS
jgi:hypothetical protein